MADQSSATSAETLSDSDRTYQIRKIPHIVHLSTDLRGPSISREGIRHDLAKAQADGFDPKDLYEKALIAKELKGETQYPAPPYSEVAPHEPPTNDIAPEPSPS